jgi:hypothetical protein
MWKTALKYIPTVAMLIIGGGLEVSGVEIPWLGYSLMIIGGFLLIIPAWPTIKRMRFQKPIIITSGQVTSKNQLDKLGLVIKAIDEARVIQPKSDETVVYITEANGLTRMYPEELRDILLKLQEQGTLTLETFPEWLLSDTPFTKKKLDDEIRSVLEPQRNHFTVILTDNFAKLAKHKR